MINIGVLGETMVFFVERNKLPQRPAYSTLRNWAKHGVKSQVSEERVTLEYYYRGKSLVTSLEAYDRFHRRVNGVPIP